MPRTDKVCAGLSFYSSANTVLYFYFCLIIFLSHFLLFGVFSGLFLVIFSIPSIPGRRGNNSCNQQELEQDLTLF